ncbi:S24 family peptidase [Henriciella mobilis]|uniref:S24 family peptidase n=1 Tax=Henriciella mobilis TaxID=2305467 RepID=UPI0013142FFF|nr:helix-turn-helix transcriptional regulator [Henriciella mobilis]
MKLSPARQLLVDRAAEADTTLKELSLKLGRNHAYLQQFVMRGSPRVLPEDVREKLADSLGGAPGDYRDGGVPSIAPRTNTEDDFLTVPIYDLRASAGAGAFAEDGEPVGYQPYRVQQLRRLTRSDTESLAVITVGGDSMWETLHDGDQVLVDRSVNRIVRDGIYILAFEDELLVKRCQRDLETKEVIVKSDNPVYDTFRISSADKLNVLGRVIWIGRALG